MGNNPVNGVDPDGGFNTPFGAWLYKVFNGGGEIMYGEDVGEYFVSHSNYGSSFNGGAEIGVTRSFGWDDGNWKGRSLNNLDYGLDYVKDFAGGVKDFGEQFITMKYLTNFANSDKYFHSKANFNATLRGDGGEFAAEKMSNLREIIDERIKGDMRIWSLEDQEANRYGREQAKHYRCHGGQINYKEAIPKYRANILLDEQGY